MLRDKRTFYAYRQVEALRQQLLQDKTVLEVEDFGAGSVSGQTRQRKVASIARHAAKSKKLAQLLFRIVHYYAPATIVELGTSLGISSAYMAIGNPHATLITGEGSAAIAKLALRNFAALRLSNTRLVQGNFDDTLPEILQTISVVDLAFIDGNHRLQPTLRYFEQLLAKTHNDSIIILDDIHWSHEMEQAWATIRQHPAVTFTIDLFFIGLVFFRNEFKEKQHFTLRF